MRYIRTDRRTYGWTNRRTDGRMYYRTNHRTNCKTKCMRDRVNEPYIS